MLILSRTPNESVIIDLSHASDADIDALRSGRTVIEVMVSAIRGDKCRMGFIAPVTIGVDREEVYLAKSHVSQAQTRWAYEAVLGKEPK